MHDHGLGLVFVRMSHRLMGLCIISDRHAGILATMEEPDWQPPYYAHHRFCLCHLLSNFNRAMGNVQLKKLFARIVEQSPQVKILNCLKAIRTVKREAIFCKTS